MCYKKAVDQADKEVQYLSVRCSPLQEHASHADCHDHYNQRVSEQRREGDNNIDYADRYLEIKFLFRNSVCI